LERARVESVEETDKPTKLKTKGRSGDGTEPCAEEGDGPKRETDRRERRDEERDGTKRETDRRERRTE
jgi:hypothetical protein